MFVVDKLKKIFWRKKMGYTEKKGGIAEIVRNTLITEYGYEADGDYVRKLIGKNYGLCFYYAEDDKLYICAYHQEGAQFSPTQRSVIFDVLGRGEFIASFSKAEEGVSGDGKPEIYATLKIGAFSGWENADIADWIVKLFAHFTTTVTLLELA
jgi:hypothetical protein